MSFFSFLKYILYGLVAYLFVWVKVYIYLASNIHSCKMMGVYPNAHFRKIKKEKHVHVGLAVKGLNSLYKV